MPALNRKIATATMVGISVSAAVVGCSSTDTTPKGGSRSPSATDSARSSSVGSARYEDGRYKADGQYGGQPSSIGVSVTLDDGAITAVTVTPHATNATSRDYQERFADAVPKLVVGKRIDEVNLDRVAGSSGTPDGFNAAIERIKDEASD
ncbi:hypothetical protein [Streptomyces violaceusniger]|uniref:FMN-binding domain-containing protein n=1 Tax=Streptomyces violaceusniger (strain Tu 4113) TaxID=653045 RepID=G2PF54_STRV4|nr:hypothetical protein [Streptomyces violaceusniger]AEM84060.1 hypothetical protein Strvi_4422 [Streptomyces violaceusniger Tu 4113]